MPTHRDSTDATGRVSSIAKVVIRQPVGAIKFNVWINQVAGFDLFASCADSATLVQSVVLTANGTNAVCSETNPPLR